MYEYEYNYLEDGTKIWKGKYILKRLIKGHKWNLKLKQIIEGLSEFDIEVPYFPKELSKIEIKELDKKYKYAFEEHSFTKFKETIKEERKDYYNFALLKWFNSKIHDLVIGLFLEMKGTHIEFNDENKEVDLFINKIPIDIKTAKLPYQFFKTRSKEEIITNLLDKEKRLEYLKYQYKNDTRNGIVQNRLYIIYHNEISEDYKEPRFDLKSLEILGEEFIQNCEFDELEIEGKIVKVGIIIVPTRKYIDLDLLPNHKYFKD